MCMHTYVFADMYMECDNGDLLRLGYHTVSSLHKYVACIFTFTVILTFTYMDTFTFIGKCTCMFTFIITFTSTNTYVSDMYVM